MIIGMAAIGYLVVDFNLQFEELPNKPYKCCLCLTWWISLFPAMWVYGWEGIFVAAIAGIVSETISQKIL